jgi:hypothetical protein
MAIVLTGLRRELSSRARTQAAALALLIFSPFVI